MLSAAASLFKLEPAEANRSAAEDCAKRGFLGTRSEKKCDHAPRKLAENCRLFLTALFSELLKMLPTGLNHLLV